MKKIFLISMGTVIVITFMILVALYIPNAVPADLDFTAVYNSSVALVHRAPIYDIPAVRVVTAKNAGVPLDKFFLPRFPYPPWYTLSTFYLGWLPIHSAATLWFELNLAMLFFSIWFLVASWPSRMRLLAFPEGLLFIPVVGALIVGQNDFPTLLGGAMLIYALRKEHVFLTTLGTVLITYKPHLGALMALSVLIYIIARRDKFGQSVLRAFLLAGIFLFAISLIADPLWYIRYPQMLLGITSTTYGSGGSDPYLCVKICTSLPVWLSKFFFNEALTKTTIIIAIVLLAFLLILFLQVRLVLLRQAELFLNVSVITTLLISPYLFNYDFILLLMPLALLWETKKDSRQTFLVSICYLVPTIALAIYGRAGNNTLLIATALLAVLIFLRAKSQVDVPTITAYNTDN